MLRLRQLEQESLRLRAPILRPREDLAKRYDLCGIVYASPQMHEVVALAVCVVRADVPVLISGPNGAGKERIAETVRANSPRKGKPFVKVNASLDCPFDEHRYCPSLFSAAPARDDLRAARERTHGEGGSG